MRKCKVSFCETPVEEYELEGFGTLQVKREDLCASHPMPPLAKMRGIYDYINNRKEVGCVGVLDTRVSKSGLGVAVISNSLGIACNYYFPAKKGEDWKTEHRLLAQEVGARLIPMTAGRIGIVYARAKKIEEGVMLPLGFPVYETVQATSKVLQKMGAPFFQDLCIVVPMGTGTIFAGIVHGLASLGLETVKLVGVSASMSIKKIEKRIVNHLLNSSDVEKPAVEKVLKNVSLYSEGDSYYEAGKTVPPWPSHPYYERKALDWMIRNRSFFAGKPVLFWNIGS